MPPEWAKELMWGYNKEPSVTFHLSALMIQGLPVFTIQQISESTHGAETHCAKAGPRADTTGPDQQLLWDYHFHEEQQVLIHKNRFIHQDCLAADHYPQTHMWPALDFSSSYSCSKILREKSNSPQQYANGLPSPWITTSQGRTILQEHHSPGSHRGFSTQAAPASSLLHFTDFISVLKLPAKV